MTSSGFGNRLARAWRFLVEDIWDIELTSLSGWGRWGVQAARVVNLVFKGFKEDECPLHASALTFSTLMSLVPILALSLALAKGLGDAETAKNKMRGAIYDWTQKLGSTNIVAVTDAPTVDGETVELSTVAEQTSPELGDQINSFVDELFDKIENVSFTALGGVGLVILVWMVIQVLGRVEGSFNRVWGVAVGRSVWRRFTDYLSILFILPVLIVAASSVPIMDFAARFLSEDSAEMAGRIMGSGILKNFAVFGMTGLAFTFLIMFMPNTKVGLPPGLAGGFVSSLLFLIWLSICAAIQVGAARYGKIYGSFAVVPILLAWVFVSWEIVLFGAETAFAVQNCGTYRMEQGSRHANLRARVTLSLSVLMETARAMMGDTEGFEISDYARKHRVSVRLLQGVVHDLVRMGFLAEVTEGNGRCVLLKSPSLLRVKDVLDAVVETGVRPEDVGLDTVDPALDKMLGRIGDSVSQTLGEQTIANLVASSAAGEGDTLGAPS